MELVLVVGESFYAVLCGESLASFSIDDWIKGAALEEEKQTGVSVDHLDHKLRLRVLLVDFIQWDLERRHYTPAFVKARLKKLRDTRQLLQGTLGRVGGSALEQVTQSIKGLLSEEEDLKRRYDDSKWRMKRKAKADLSLLNAFRFVELNPHFWTTEDNRRTGDQERLTTRPTVEYLVEILRPYGINRANIWMGLKRSKAASPYWGESVRPSLPLSVTNTDKETIVTNDLSLLQSPEILKACKEANMELRILEEDPLPSAEVQSSDEKVIVLSHESDEPRLSITHFRIKEITSSAR